MDAEEDAHGYQLNRRTGEMTNWCCDCAHEDELLAWSDRCCYYCIPNAKPGERPWGHHYAPDSPFRDREREKHGEAVGAGRDAEDNVIHTGVWECPECGGSVPFTEADIIRHLKSCGGRKEKKPR